MREVLCFLVFVTRSVCVGVRFLVFRANGLFVLGGYRVLFPLGVPMGEVDLGVIVVSYRRVGPNVQSNKGRIVCFFRFP